MSRDGGVAMEDLLVASTGNYDNSVALHSKRL